MFCCFYTQYYLKKIQNWESYLWQKLLYPIKAESLNTVCWLNTRKARGRQRPQSVQQLRFKASMMQGKLTENKGVFFRQLETKSALMNFGLIKNKLGSSFMFTGATRQQSQHCVTQNNQNYYEVYVPSLLSIPLLPPQFNQLFTKQSIIF